MHDQDHRGADAVGRHACEQQADRRHLPLLRGGRDDEPEDDGGPDQRAAPDARHTDDDVPAERDRQNCAKRGASGDAECVGSRERLAQHRLEQTAGQRERRAAEETEQRACDPQVHQDGAVWLLTRPRASEVERRGPGERQQERGGGERERRPRNPRRAMVRPGAHA